MVIILDSTINLGYMFFFHIFFLPEANNCLVSMGLISFDTFTQALLASILCKMLSNVFKAFVSFRVCCGNKIPEARWCIKSRRSFLAVLDVGSPVGTGIWCQLTRGRQRADHGPSRP